MNKIDRDQDHLNSYNNRKARQNNYHAMMRTAATNRYIALVQKRIEEDRKRAEKENDVK